MGTQRVQHGSYRPEEGWGGFTAELDRLRVQVELSWSEEVRLLTALGLRDSMDVIELGSGPGFVTERLVAALPTARITGIDINSAMNSIAREQLADVADRVQIIEGSVAATGLGPAQFDFALARYLFQHLTEPMEAIREAWRLLRPGGKLAVIDIDVGLWGISAPAYASVQAIYQKAERLQLERKGNRMIGRQLWKLLQTGGFEEVRLEAFVYHSDELGFAAFAPQLNPYRLAPAVAAGLITADEFATVRAAYKHMSEVAEPYVLMVGLLAHGTKPQAK